LGGSSGGGSWYYLRGAGRETEYRRPPQIAII
jgi:hypothetical protein